MSLWVSGLRGHLVETTSAGPGGLLLPGRLLIPCRMGFGESFSGLGYHTQGEKETVVKSLPGRKSRTPGHAPPPTSPTSENPWDSALAPALGSYSGVMAGPVENLCVGA